MNINVNISYLEDERSYWNSVLLVGGGVIPLIHTWHHPRRCISVITDIFQLELSINLL